MRVERGCRSSSVPYTGLNAEVLDFDSAGSGGNLKGFLVHM